jgi:3-hydroxyacyl-CoA dehydrogenase
MSGIADVSSVARLPKVLPDIKQELLDSPQAAIERNMDCQVSRKTTTADTKTETLVRFAISLDSAALRCDPIEATAEKEAVKKDFYRMPAPRLRPGCTIASGISSISVTPLGAEPKRCRLWRRSLVSRRRRSPRIPHHLVPMINAAGVVP